MLQETAVKKVKRASVQKLACCLFFRHGIPCL